MTEQLQEMKARLEAATPGPWKFDLDYWLQSDDPSADYIIFPGTYMEDDVQRLIINDHDADFIAHAPEAQAKLIAALEAVEALATGAPRMVTFTGATVSGIVVADDILAAIAEALA